MNKFVLFLLTVALLAMSPSLCGVDEQVALQQGSSAPASKTPGASVEPRQEYRGPSEIQLLKMELDKIRNEVTQLKRNMAAITSQLKNHEEWIQKRSGVVASFCKADGETLMAFNGLSKSCMPYRCDKEWGSCSAGGCFSRLDCASGYQCSADGICYKP